MGWLSIFGETEFIAAVVSSVVGGGIAYLMQRSATGKEDRRRSAERKEAQQALGQSLLIKTIRIQSNIGAIQKYITVGSTGQCTMIDFVALRENYSWHAWV
ncbi:hypothetical protein, partial [Microvirga zambiensis]|uniref:hypothetical protein n=1 Tax=Microvirga zambiensis TaxID=1402137 RepID=UPI00191E8998